MGVLLQVGVDDRMAVCVRKDPHVLHALLLLLLPGMQLLQHLTAIWLLAPC